MAPLALGKVASMLFKVLVKPVSNGLKDSAKEPGNIRTAALKVGRWYHKVDVGVQRYILGRRPCQIKEMSETWAIARGADVISEFAMMSLMSGFLLQQYFVHVKNDREKQELAKIEEVNRRHHFNNKVTELDLRMNELCEVVERLREDVRVNAQAATAAALRADAAETQLATVMQPSRSLWSWLPSLGI